jgi:hypothetical protein
MKFHFTPDLTEYSHSSDRSRNPSTQIWKRFCIYAFAVHDIFDVPPEEEVHGGQLNIPPLPVSHPEQFVKWHKNDLMHHPVGK